MAIDPVCMMEVDEDRARYGVRCKGETYYFCAESCKKKFEEDPERYAKKVQELSEDTGG